MRLLIASGSLGKYFHFKEFSNALQKLGVDTKLVIESEYSNGFPSKKISQWFSTKKFNNLIKDFKPDAVFIDRQLHFGADTLKAGIPLFGIDFDEKIILNEIGEEAISYEKGCFVGQEVIARIKNIGKGIKSRPK